MMRSLIYNLALSLAYPTLVGCVSVGAVWRQDGVDPEQFLVDKENCRSRARKEAEDSYTNISRNSSAGGVNNETSYNTLMRKYDARSYTRKIFERCLIQHGYKRIDATKMSKNTSEI